MSFLEKNAEVLRGEASGLCNLTLNSLENITHLCACI